MSVTLVIWLALFATLLVLSIYRTAYGVALYMLTFFASPPFWWWGDPIRGYRWNLFSGIALLVAVIVAEIKETSAVPNQHPLVRRMFKLTILILLNATLVHALLAPSSSISVEVYSLLVKFVVLFFLMFRSIRTRDDLRIVLLSIVLGAGYVGYEVTVNDRGRLTGGRLEGVGVPAASTANGLACLMVTVLPIAGALFLIGTRCEKAIMLAIAPLILNVILLCNSRGAFIATILGTLVLIVISPPRIRSQVLKLSCLGAVALWVLLGDPRILERFSSTFAAEEERDSSAQSRLEFWKAGVAMIPDHPLGAGGDGFRVVYGVKYLREAGASDISRSVHNGYINEACEWGLQGLALRLALMWCVARMIWECRNALLLNGDFDHQVLSCALCASISGFLATSMFGDYLDAEWGYWLAAIAAAQVKLLATKSVVRNPEEPQGNTVYPAYSQVV